MYILFRDFHWKPSDYFLMDEGEKIVTRAFISKFLEEEAKKRERMENELKKIKG